MPRSRVLLGDEAAVDGGLKDLKFGALALLRMGRLSANLS
jgi:hypothetical protein